MSNKSIDGLQRRTSTQGGRKVTANTTVKRRTVKRVSVDAPKTASNQATTRRKIGIPDTKKDLKALIAENEELERKNDTKSKAEKNSVKEYLSEVKDVDPTDLVEVPKYFYVNDFVATVTDGGNIINVIFADPDTPLAKDENGRTNILVFGTEGYSMDNPNYDGGWLTDAMLVLSINQDNGDVKAVSLPRDLKMERGCTGTAKMNEIYWCEYSKYTNAKKDKKTEEFRKEKENQASQNLADAFKKVTGLTIHYRVHVNWDALIKVIDALDGVDVCFYYKTNSCGDDVTAIEVSDKRGLSETGVEKGRRVTYFAYETGKKYHLTGWRALEVARSRNSHGGYGAGNGNFSREYFQQRIIEATGRRAKEKNIDIATALNIKAAIGDNVRTTIKDTEIKTLLKLATSLDINSLQTISLQKANLLTTGTINGISYVLPRAGTYNYSAIQNYIKRMLSSEGFTSEDAQLVVLNGTAVSGIANKEKTTLENKGYAIASTGNAPSDLSGFDGVKV